MMDRHRKQAERLYYLLSKRKRKRLNGGILPILLILTLQGVVMTASDCRLGHF